MRAGVWGIGSYVPEKIVTNNDLEKILDTSDEWIRTRTGIEERHIAEDHMTTADMAYEAAKKAIANANISPEEIDLILVATVTPDYSFPTVSCTLQERLGADNAAAMDISAACSGFIYGMVTAQQFIENKASDCVLVIGAEKLSKITDWEDRNTAVLFGDGAGAAIMGAVSDGKGLLAFELGADGAGGKHLYHEKHIHMNGREVFKFAVRKMGDISERVLEKAGVQKENVDYLIPHQANIRIIEAARERLQLPAEKVSITVNKYGNTSSASIPLSLVDALVDGMVKDGDTIVLVGFGGGLTWGAILLKWGR